MIARWAGRLRAVTPAEFEQIALAALHELPPWAVEALTNVIVLFEEEDCGRARHLRHLRRRRPARPRRRRTDRTGPHHLYRAPLVADFGHDPVELAEEIRVTVLHEIAHHFGIDDDRLNELGYG